MTVTVLAQLKTKPGLAESVLTGLKEMLPDTRAFAGCRGLNIVRDVDDPDAIALIEEWDERANHEAYLAWRAERGDLDGLVEVLAEAPKFTYYEQRRDIWWG
jgi:quinol monooxygenase YgiN